MSRRLALVLAPVVLLALGGSGVALHDGDHSEDRKTAARSEAAFPPGLVLPALEGPKPWSDKPLLNDPDRFQIAIMTDRTGGHRPGIWMKAIRRLNMLRPQFVMSVGDLIEGYTADETELERQWSEFLGFIDEMQMKFFFAAGNHDLSNPTMHRLWREKFGPEWYSFDYKGVHFICLSSEDPQTTIGEEQLAWLETDLDASAGARWTLLFLHKPLWVYAERELGAGNPDPTNWTKVEALLGDRPFTVFAGHVHHYVQYDRNGRKYYHLATTGGGSRLRGIPYGEFDHVTWLTMEYDGPRIAHLLLDGILSPDTVTEAGIARFRRFLAGTVVEIAPILLEPGESFGEGRIDLRLLNEFDTDVEFSGQIAGFPLRGLTVDPAELTLSAAPNASAELAVDVSFSKPIEVSQLVNTVLTAKIKTVGEGAPLTSERVVPVVIDRRFSCPRSESIVVDGSLGDWDALAYETPEQPLLLGSTQDWQGPGDASVRFAVAHDKDSLYLAADVRDDAPAEGDGLSIYLDTRPIQLRARDSSLRRGAYLIRALPSAAEEAVALRVAGRDSAALSERIEKGMRRTAGGYQLELAVPLDSITASQGDDWHSFQMTLVVEDVDEAGQRPARVVWRGSGNLRRNTGFAHFVRMDE